MVKNFRGMSPFRDGGRGCLIIESEPQIGQNSAEVHRRTRAPETTDHRPDEGLASTPWRRPQCELLACLLVLRDEGWLRAAVLDFEPLSGQTLESGVQRNAVKRHLFSPLSS
jgi:hypothetical protein